MNITIPISKSGPPLYRQVYASLRQSILGGAFRAGERLPSTRDLAEQLGISRTVTVLAYEQLTAEGYIESRPGSGAYVSAGLPLVRADGAGKTARLKLTRYGAFAAKASATVSFPDPAEKSLRYDFQYGRSDLEIFPFELWWRLLLRKARKGPVRELDYGMAAGSEALREAIAAHLRRSRAVVCDASQVVIVNGSQQALDLIVRVLMERGDTAVIENPSYQGAREVLRAAGVRLHPVAVDADGLRTDALPEGAKAVFVTPSHQFPTGAILPLGRRRALIDWARRSNAVIVEDDYDGEFHYQGRPVESLQGLESEGRVIYVGTFSRTMFPALRIGYLVTPKSLLPAFTAAKWLSDRHTATLEQEALAEFISSGLYERHLRRVRRKMAENRTVLLEAIGLHLGDRVDVTGDGAGAHMVLWPRRPLSEKSVIAAAGQRGVGVYGVGGYYLGGRRRPGLMLGYSRLRAADIRAGVKRLADVV